MGTNEVLSPAAAKQASVVQHRGAQASLTAIESDEETADNEHLVRVGRFAASHENAAQQSAQVVDQQASLSVRRETSNARQPPKCRATSARSLPAVAISHESAADAADHSADAEDAHGYRVDERDVIVGDLLTVADLVGCADELLDDLQVDRRRR